MLSRDKGDQRTVYWIRGVLHNPHRPAHNAKDLYKANFASMTAYYQKGNCHNIVGPAKEYADYSLGYFINGHIIR